jgi:putative DNA primase/helicase
VTGQGAAGIYEGLDLAPQHAAKIGSSAISREVAEQRGYQTIRTKSGLAEFGFGRSQQIIPTLLVPVWGVTGEIATRQHRPDSPRERKGKGNGKSKIVKYETPDGSRMVLDVPPGARAGIGDPKVPLWITEGVLKADSAVSAGLCCVAVLGVWNWRGTNADGGKTALADWECVALNGREVFIVFDSDVMTKRAVHDALARLGAFLTRRGAAVAYVYLPQGESGAKVGLDDFLADRGTTDGLRRLARTRLADQEGAERAWPSPQDPMAVARRYMQEYTKDGMPLLRRWRGAWMRWETTHWAEADDATVRAELYKALEHATWIGLDNHGEPDESGWQPNRNKIANVIEALGAITHLPDKLNTPAWLDRDGPRPAHWGNSGMVACTNGLLDVTTRKLLPHTPAYFNVVSVPFDYEPGAAAPQWTEFLEKLWPEDPDSVDALQEFAGYLLSGETNLHKILLVIGPTRAGKGTIGRIFTMLLGADNVAGPTLASLATQFGLAPLIGKPLATISDARLSGNSTTVVERLLSISGEDALTIDRKYREPWTGQLPTRIMIMSNELPGFGDASGAIAHRFIVLVLTRSWLGKEDKELTGKLAGELPGILNWSLDGLARLEASGRLTEPKSSEDAAIALLDQASPMSAFVRDCCEIGLDFSVPVDDVYEAWKAWCEANGRDKPGSVQTLGKNLNAAAPGVRRHRPREDGTRPRVYQGIHLRDGWECQLGGSGSHNDADRGPSRTTPPEPAPDNTPEASPVRDGPRPNPLRAQLRPVGDTPADEPAEQKPGEDFWAGDEGNWSA